MNDWIIFIIGALVGVGLGSYFTALAKPQKPWSELTERKKKIRKVLLTVGVMLFFTGVVVFFLFQNYK